MPVLHIFLCTFLGPSHTLPEVSHAAQRMCATRLIALRILSAPPAPRARSKHHTSSVLPLALAPYVPGGRRQRHMGGPKISGEGFFFFPKAVADIIIIIIIIIFIIVIMVIVVWEQTPRCGHHLGFTVLCGLGQLLAWVVTVLSVPRPGTQLQPGCGPPGLGGEGQDTAVSLWGWSLAQALGEPLSGGRETRHSAMLAACPCQRHYIH